MTDLSDRRHDAFDNPAKMACRAGNRREPAYRRCRRWRRIHPEMEAQPMIDWRQFLTGDLQVCHGQLCAQGTRVFVTNILDSLAEGATRDDILRGYLSLRPEHIDAAVSYAA